MIKILKYVSILNFSMNFILLKKLFLNVKMKKKTMLDPNKVIESGLNTKKSLSRSYRLLNSNCLRN